MMNYHKPYFDWMNLSLEGEVDPEQRAQLDAHLAECLECLSVWEALRATDELLTATPSVTPRSGFTGRFKARLSQNRAQPRVWWGVVALGFSSLGGAALFVPVAIGLLLSATRIAQQPATSAAFFSGFTALVRFGSTVGEALLITAQTLVASPVVWTLPVCAIGVMVAWAIAVRKLIVGVPA